jgi:8-oxo-dGTP diphosphatase
MPNSYFKNLPKKIMAAGVLLFDKRNNILILKPIYKKSWSIPGGVVEKNESIFSAAARECQEETGLKIFDLQLVCVDYMTPHATEYPTKAENIQFLFYGGILTDKQINKIRLQLEEISEHAFKPVNQALKLINNNLARRIPKAIKAIKNKTAVYLENGNQV